MKKLTAAIIACDEEAKIGRALESLLGIADEIIVVDSGSVDRTPEICAEYGARFIVREWQGYRNQKQYATDLAGFDWVLSLDADEELSAELREEIIKWKNSSENGTAGFFLPRMTWLMGSWIKHTTWYPDWQLRLFRKDQGKWTGLNIHESFRVEGKTAKMTGHLLHYTYSSVSEYLVQLEKFTSLAAEDYVARGKKPGILRLVLSPPAVFLKNFVLKAGFLDGRAGFAVSCFSAVSTFFKLLKTEELRRGHQ